MVILFYPLLKVKDLQVYFCIFRKFQRQHLSCFQKQSNLQEQQMMNYRTIFCGLNTPLNSSSQTFQIKSMLII